MFILHLGKTKLMAKPRADTDKDMRKAGEAYSTKERAELLLSNLEKLIAEVCAIEAQYDVLKADYTRICDDAILKISAIKTDLEECPETKIEELEVFNSEISNLEARFKLGLVPVETYLKQMGVSNGDVALVPGRLRSIIDKVADGIEFGLDKMGDGIIFPIEKMVNVYTAISNIANWKAKKRHYFDW